MPHPPYSPSRSVGTAPSQPLPAPAAPAAGAERAAQRANGERVLVVDDEPDIAALLATGLRFVGYQVEAVTSGSAALAAAADFGPELLLLDVMLPDINGFDLCRRLRAEHPNAGVIFLTARNRTEDAVAGLTIGADDYISKPFSLDEVAARIRAVLRRLSDGAPDAAADGVLRCADLTLDDRHHEVQRGAEPIELSPTEFTLLRYLLENVGVVVSKPQILAHVWAYDFDGGAAVVEHHISALRKKIDRGTPSLIRTVRGVGYTLRENR